MVNPGTSIRAHATSLGCAIPHPCAKRAVSIVQTSTGLTSYVFKLFSKRSIACHCDFSRTLSSVTPHPEGVYPSSCKRCLARAHPGHQHGRKRGFELPWSPTALRVLYPHKVWGNHIFGRLRFSISASYQQLFWLRRVSIRAHALFDRRTQAPYAAVRRAKSACNGTRPADVHAEAQDYPADHRDSHCGLGMAVSGRRIGQAHGGKSFEDGPIPCIP